MGDIVRMSHFESECKLYVQPIFALFLYVSQVTVQG